MTRYTKYPVKRPHGSTLVGTIAFTVIVAMLLAGVATMAVTHFERSKTESHYQEALAVAEAGINYEIHKISTDPANADQAPGKSYDFDGGSYTVYCANKDGSTPWAAPEDLYIFATGIKHGISRTVRVAAKGYTTTGDYAIYSIKPGALKDNAKVIGDVGTNMGLVFNGDVQVSGNVVFNGCSGTLGNPYKVKANPNALEWPTADQIALALFPNNGSTAPGGVDYIAAHNDNDKAIPAITSNKISMSGNETRTLTAGNYYINSLFMKGNSKLIIDNSKGPVNVWYSNCGSFWMQNHASIQVVDKESKQNSCTFYGAHQLDMHDNAHAEAVLYAYNSMGGQSVGDVHLTGNPTIEGQLIAGNNCLIENSSQITYHPGWGKPSANNHYGYDDQWVELDGVQP